MNRQELRVLLAQERVSPDAFDLDGDEPDECLCLGPETGGWVVFYAERGGRTQPEHFGTEHEACDHMAGRLLADAGNRVRPDER